MKKLLLLTAVSVASALTVSAEVPVPKHLENAAIYSVSSNGHYAVSQARAGVKIFNLVTGQEDSYFTEDGGGDYSLGIGKCVSDNGIVVGSSDGVSAQYWKDGEWYTLEYENDSQLTNLANAITADGSRICGSVGSAALKLDGDALMQVPVIWNAEGNGYGKAVLLPHPDLDFTGRVPQYITAVDITGDGKTVIGQVRDAVGFANYPIIYTEDENGEWSYTIPHADFLFPEGVVFPEYPGECPEYPADEDFMTPEEKQAYEDALNEYHASGELPYPKMTDYMSEAELEAYNNAIAEFDSAFELWETNNDAWFDVYQACTDFMPGYVFNTVRVSDDGKTYGATIGLTDPDNPWAFGYSFYHVWLFDVDSDKIVKYNQLEDLNLSCLANDGMAVATTSIGTGGNSYILSAGNVEDLHEWMTKKCSAYGEWMTENMSFEYPEFEQDPETGKWNEVFKSEMLTGHAVATPDFSVVCTYVENIWDYETEAESYVFPVKEAEGSGVAKVDADYEGDIIFDLSGRQLKSADAPGVYIVNGKKKMVF